MNEAERIVADFEEAVAKHEAVGYEMPILWHISKYWDEQRRAYRDLIEGVLSTAIAYRRAKHDMDAAKHRNDLAANREAWKRAKVAGAALDMFLIDLEVDLDTTP